jgi:hypothetical protein
MIAVLRSLLGLSGEGISKEHALETARARCAQEGWPWVEPVRVNVDLREYHVMTNAEMRGGNVNIRIDRRSGEVRSAHFARR